MSEKAPKKIDHIGIAVKSIEAVLPFYIGSLKMSLVTYEDIVEQGVKIAILDVGETKIELMEPLTEDSPVGKFIRKRGEGIHHIAIGVANIENRIEDIKENGIQVINEEPVQGTQGSKISFLHPKSAHGVLIELCENEGIH